MTITNTDANNAIINPIDLWRASGAIAHSNLGIVQALSPETEIDEDAVKKTILRNRLRIFRNSPNILREAVNILI